MNIKLPPLPLIITMLATFLVAGFVFIRSLIVEYYGWGFYLAAIYFVIGAFGFFFLLLSVDNNLRYQRLSGLSLNKDGDLEFKRMKQFAKFLQIPNEQLAKDFSMINSKLQTKATAKELMNSIAKLIVRDRISYDAILHDFKTKKPNSIKNLTFQLKLTIVTRN